MILYLSSQKAHQYFDNNYSGSATDCVPSLNMETIFQPLTTWARSKGIKGYLFFFQSFDLNLNHFFFT